MRDPGNEFGILRPDCSSVFGSQLTGFARFPCSLIRHTLDALSSFSKENNKGVARQDDKQNFYQYIDQQSLFILDDLHDCQCAQNQQIEVLCEVST